MFSVKTKTDAQLSFIAADCEDAIKAMPRNPKTYEYLKTMNDCHDELNRRARLRLWRKTANDFIFDDLKKPIDRWFKSERKRIRDCNCNPYNRDRFYSSSWILASYKKYGLV